MFYGYEKFADKHDAHMRSLNLFDGFWGLFLIGPCASLTNHNVMQLLYP